jgi:putative spermidine/putrescine transport system ATP-binding protein
MARLELDNVTVAYGSVTVLPGLSLAVAEGECIALLGPSGCGKTTTLRAVAGFVSPSAGQIRIGGRDVRERPPHKRNVGLVFQDYALFPHMTVSGNVAYGLQRRGVPKPEIATRVAQALAMVRLSSFGDRYPSALSGGQRQRVALARALVIEPDILLLDEPLGALDRKLRDEMQFELKTLQERLGVTCIIVTHDQEEALSLASRVALMFDGDIEEIGPPSQLYHRPGSARAMDFLGASSTFDAELMGLEGGFSRFRTTEGLSLAGPALELPPGRKVRLGVRPELITLSRQATSGENVITGQVAQVVFKGGAADVYVQHGGQPLRAQIATASARDAGTLSPGATVWARFAPADVLVFPQ